MTDTTADTAEKESMSSNTRKSKHLRVVNSTPASAPIPWVRIGLMSAFGAIVTYATIEGVKHLRKKSSESEEKKPNPQQTMLMQLANTNPTLFQSPFMQQLAAQNGLMPANPMLSGSAEEPAVPAEAPKWFTEFAARMTALEKKSKPPKAKRSKPRKPRVVREEEYDDYEDEDDYEDAV